jgi:hypothetical protein
VCSNGTCTGTPLQCSDNNVCNGIETCDPKTGCQPGTPLVCDDGNACNGVETCDPKTGCHAGTPLNCDDGNACNGVETCDPKTGCQPGTPLNCDDGIACTADGCVSGTGCVHAIADGPAGVSCVWTVARQSNACAGASVPSSADRHVMKAAGLIGSGLTTTRPPRARRLFGNAKQALGRVGPILKKATRKGKIPAACDNSLSGALAEDLDRLR